MADTVSRNVRRKNMIAIRSGNTKPELAVRKLLFSKGYRYRLHCNTLPGKPDIVLKKLRTTIFVNGCFWHQHLNCRYAAKPKSNKRFWLSKLSSNVQRDHINTIKLKRLGYKVIIIWECDIKKFRDLLSQNRLSKIILSRLEKYEKDS